MTTLELQSLETLRDHARVLRRMRRDGIVVSARQRAVGEGSPGEVALFAPLGERRWLVGVVDAKVRDAVAAEIARDVARQITVRAVNTRHLGDVLSAANDFVHDAAGGDELVSAALFVLDGARCTIRMANAGQIAPLAVGRSGGVIALDGHGPALGLLADQTYRAAGPLRLAPGMIVLAVTDGVHDAVDGEGHPFGREGVGRSLAAARQHGPRAVVRRVLADVARHAAPEEADHRTALAFAFRGV